MHTLLAAGVSPKYIESARQKGITVALPVTSGTLQDSVDKLMSDVKTLQDTTFVPFFFDFDDAKNDEEFLALLQSRKWTGIALGGGIRTTLELSEKFTEVLNLVVREQPQATLVFPTTPAEVVPQFRRFLPQLA